MTAKEWNIRALGDSALAELAEAMGLGEFVSMTVRDAGKLGDMRALKFERGDVCIFRNGVHATTRRPRKSIEVSLTCEDIASLTELARKLRVAEVIGE